MLAIMSAESVEVPAVITLTSPRDVLDAIPHSLGFYPGNSLVISLLADTARGRRRQVLVIRLDLIDDSDDVEVVDWPSVHTAMATSGATSAVIAVFATRGTQSQVQTQQRPLIERVKTVLADEDIDVMDALIVADGCYVSLVCADPSCCPPEGISYDVVDPGAIGVELAVRGGSSPLLGRDDVADQFAIDPQAQALIQALMDELADGVGLDAEQILAWGSKSAPATSQVAQSLMAFADVGIRDAVIAGALCENADNEERLRSFFSYLITVAPDGYRAAPATMSAIAWWVEGDGARANICLDLAFEDNSDYRLAELFKQIMRAAVRPEQVRELLAEAMTRA